MNHVLLVLFTILRTGTILCLACVILILVYRLYLHPLARIPGPRLAAASSIWHAYHIRNGRVVDLGKALHKQYGHVVRVGPNEVSFTSEEAFRQIYKPGSGFLKSDFYLATALFEPTVSFPLRLHFPHTLDLLSERSLSRYRLQRRLIGPVYSPSNLARHGPAIDRTLDSLVSRFKGFEATELDLKEWMHITAVEILGAVVLSWSPGYLRDGTDWGSGAHSYMGWRKDGVMGLFPAAVKAGFLWRPVGRLFARLWGLGYSPPKNFKPFFPGVSRVAGKRISAALNGRKDMPKRDDLLADLIALHETKPEFTETYLRRMTVTNFGAGHETLCSAFTSIFTMLATHPDAQARVAAEARLAASTGDGDLRYTWAVIKESLRLHPVLGMSLPRVVPAGGMYSDGHYFPQGTTVGCYPAALHRNEDIFGLRPEEYRPERWLEADDAQLRKMERTNLVWGGGGGGGRMCPGRNLAELILGRVVSRMTKEFEISVQLPTKQSRAYFVAMMEGVMVTFVPRRDATEKQ